MISAFHVETGSLIAQELLANWQSALNRISLVMPRDFARVIAAIEKANREGLPVDQYVMEVAANG
jgi:glutamate synthase (NADPH/NADH) large chain